MSSVVVVVGDATLDVHVSPMRPLAPRSDVPAEIRMRPGGQGANLAVRLARHGVPVTLVCTLADDPAGRMVREALAEDDVSVEALPADATGVIVVIGDETGERSMLSHRAPLPPDVAANAAGLSAGWVVLSGYALLQPDALSLATRLAALPMRRVLVACAVTDDASGAWHDAARRLHPDLVIANRAEAEAARIRELGTGLAITDATGAEAAVGMANARADAVPGPPAVDTTGAGDAFAAGLLAILLGAGWPPTTEELQAAVERGVAVASAVVRHPGAQARVAGERPAILGR